jgi:endonuclease YncB( thermonuclease family)
MRKYGFFFICGFLLALSAQAQAWEARIVAVADGDTITAEPIKGGERIKIRLHGIDAPETRQPYGQAAKGFVTNLVLFKEVDVQPTPQGKDRYGRIVAVIEIPGVGILQELLLEAGLAWVYRNYCKDCEAWEQLETEARNQRKGLWIEEKPIEPWVWRKKR